LPTPLVRLHTSLHRGLSETASLWPEVRVASRWIHQVAHVLTNEAHRPGAAVKPRLGGRLGAMTRHRAAAGQLAPALAHVRNVSRSDWSGLFHCYEGPELPRTHNDLEQCFGAPRYHARRATGRGPAARGHGPPAARLGAMGTRS
jgi:hypothetical protein